MHIGKEEKQDSLSRTTNRITENTGPDTAALRQMTRLAGPEEALR